MTIILWYRRRLLNILLVLVCYRCSFGGRGRGGVEDCNVVNGVAAAAHDATASAASSRGSYSSTSMFQQYESNQNSRYDDDDHLPLSRPARPRNMICVGGSSGMGKAAALECLKHGGNVLLTSRSQTKLDKAKDQLIRAMTMAMRSPIDDDDDDDDKEKAQWEKYFSNKIQTASLDVTDETAVRHFADELTTTTTTTTCRWDVLVISVADKAPHGPMLTLPTTDTRYMIETKVWSAYNCAKYLTPVLLLRNDINRDSSITSNQNVEYHNDGGHQSAEESSSPPPPPPPMIMTPAVIFVAGILNRRPGKNCVPLAMANGALEGLTRSLALEWGPNVRVNCMSPGFCDTERFDHMSSTTKQAMMDNTAASLPLQRVGRPEDMGKALWYLATAEFCTGTVLDVDGGHGIRQYASATNDPMRRRTEDKS
mmetsp:Transcript_57624/g.140759  ORF Transcript_57624/g.140759 Transcript_57624/m.140759 type:complete len:425 (-) Transcript_57624:132-1406(-)